jgi:hypothetical protein
MRHCAGSRLQSPKAFACARARFAMTKRIPFLAAKPADAPDVESLATPKLDPADRNEAPALIGL